MLGYRHSIAGAEVGGNDRDLSWFCPGYAKEMKLVSWLLFLASVLAPAVLAGRAHSRYLDGLQADPERQLMLGISFQPSERKRQLRHRAWLQQAMLDLS